MEKVDKLESLQEIIAEMNDKDDKPVADHQ